ncbi:MAG: ATP-dependent DNA helicase [Candidatus Omnitrophota bacterium]|nr:ATP-dependent DNA helicase [Candidatus Omnitrophota bacterium]
MKNSLKKENPHSTLEEFYAKLNGKQKLAVDTIDGPLLVLAGPGTGKTQLLSVRAKAILSKKPDVLPENILILTYTNAATKAMKERLARIIGAKGYDIDVGTFHSFANSIIQESEEAANYAGDKIQMDEVEQVRAIEYILDHAKGVDEIRPFNAPYIYLGEIKQKIGELKKDGIKPDSLDGYLAKHKKLDPYLEDKHIGRLKALAVAYRMYEDLKRGNNKEIFDERGRYDYDDMILFATEALKKELALRKKYRKQYLYVMVDEYQDTNGAQLDLLFSLIDDKDPNLCCVGDDDQSIYRFQGASVGNFRALKERFPKLKEISLEDNYRSTNDLIQVSKNIINIIPREERMAEKRLESLKDYKDKEILFREFTTEDEELLYMVDKVKELRERILCSKEISAEERNHPYNNIAVLVRKRNNIPKIIDAFIQAGIPYATDGKEDISSHKRVKQLLDVLELISMESNDIGSKDLVFYKVLTSDYFGIPHAQVLKFVNMVNKKKEKDRSVTLLSEFFEHFKPHRAYEAIKNLFDDAQTRTIHTILLNYIKDAGIFKHILKEYADKKILRIRDLRAVTSFVNMVKNADLAKPGIRLNDFILEMKTRRDHNLPVQGQLVTMTQDGVRIYTAHGSKGQEFHSVLIPFCLQNKNWPARPIPEKIPLPATLFKTKERIKEKSLLKQLALYDETRLFYVAITRAKSTLTLTASPTENTISSSYLDNIDIHRESPEFVNEEDVVSKSLELADVSDPFIGTEAILEDMVGNLSLNPTRVNNYITCKRKFLYNDVLKIPGAKKKSLVFGNCVHKALEEVYKEYKNSRFFPKFRFFLDEFKKELKNQGPDKLMESECLKKAESDDIKNWFEKASKEPVMPIDLEKKILITIGENIIFTGKYDKVEWEDEKRSLVRIVDYKTGKGDDHIKKISEACDLASDECDGYLRQLVCYKLLYERDKSVPVGIKVSHGVLAFIEPLKSELRKYGYRKGDYANFSVEISEDMVRNMEELIKKVWADIKALSFEKLPERDDDKCQKCDFDDVCWGN